MLYRRRKRNHKNGKRIYISPKYIRNHSRRYRCDLCSGTGIVNWDEYESYCTSLNLKYESYLYPSTEIMCCPVCNGNGFISLEERRNYSDVEEETKSTDRPSL